MAPFDEREPENYQAKSGSPSGYDGSQRTSGELFRDDFRAVGSRPQRVRGRSRRTTVDPAMAIYISLAITSIGIVIIHTIVS